MRNKLLRLGFLAKLFFFSLWALRLILFVGIPGAVIAIAGKIVDYGSLEPFLVVGGITLAAGSVCIYVGVVLLMFPAQLISFVSSRQYGVLPYIRHYLAVLFVCMLSILQVVACCILVFGIKREHAMHPSLIVAIMLIASFMVILFFVRLGSMQFFYFFVLPALGWYLVPKLKLMSSSVLAVILVCLWATFLGWWFSWHPKKYHKNLIVMNPSELNKQSLSFCWGLYSRGAVPQNLESGILFGQFGNSFYQVRMFLITLVVTGSVFALMFMLSPHDFSTGLMIGVKIGIGIQVIQVGYNYSLAVFKNINKYWLYFSLERMQLFNAVERKVAVFYLKNLIAITSIIWVISFFIPNYLPLENIVFYVLVSLFITPFTLYMAFIIYAKWRGNSKVFNWINGIAMMLILGACFLGLNFFGHISDYLIYILIIILASLAVILVMRQYAKRLWQQVDLVRVAI